MADLRAEELDIFVTAYLECQAEQGDARSVPEELQHLLLAGAFAAAAARLADVCPALAQSPWLQFQLKKHHLMHMASLLTSSGAGSRPEAQEQLQEVLALARRELAPLALHAYCEAYSDFKRCMLALVCGGGGAAGGGGRSSNTGQAGGPTAELAEFAGMVARAVRQQTGCEEPRLPQLLRYLLLLHQHQHHSGFHPHWWPQTSQQTRQLCERLLLPQRDALPPPELEPACPDPQLLPGGGLSARGVREHDVQALRTSLGCDREEAVTLLRRAQGNVFPALQDALQAAHIDEALLLELAQEYAACRGLELPAGGAAAAAAQAGARGAGGGPEGMQVKREAEPQPQPQQQCSPAKPPTKKRHISERSTSGAGAGTGATGAQAAAVESGGEEGDGEEALQLPAELSEAQLRQLIKQLERLLAGGHAEKALQQLEAAEPSFLQEFPAAEFALRRCCFLEQLVLQGPGQGTAAALAVVRQHLSPLAQQHPELQPHLKTALAMLLPVPAAPGAGGSGGSDEAGAGYQQQWRKGVADAVTAVRAALRPRCHIREPRLLCLLRDLLSLHAAHFKLQRCQDRFASDLGLSALKGSSGGSSSGTSGPSCGASTAAAAAAMAAATGMAAEAQQALADAFGSLGDVPIPGVRELGSESDDEDMLDGDSEGGDGGEEGAGVPEQAIITVCEFTGLPRHTAIELLLVHGGDVAAVLAQVFP